MPSNWIKDKRKRAAQSLNRDQAPIFIDPSTLSLHMKSDRISVSTYHGLRSPADIIQGAAATDQPFFHLSCVSPPIGLIHRQAIYSAAQQAWLDVRVNYPDWNADNGALSKFFDSLSQILFESGRGTLIAPFSGVTINQNTQQACISNSAHRIVVAIDNNHDSHVIGTTAQTNLLGNIPHVANSVTIEKCKAIILVKKTMTEAILLKCIQSILNGPYPKSGAAELLHYALQEANCKVGVTWMEIL